MFSAFKKIFRRSATPLPSEPIDLNVRAPEESPPSAAKATPATPASTPFRPAARPAPTAAAPADNAEMVTLSFGSILPLVPKDLIQRLNLPGLEKQTFSLSRKKVIEQLASGAVRVTIAELRRAAPVGLFVKDESQDAQQIVLPLQEIIAQLPSGQLPRRVQQKRAEIPEEVTPLFSARGEQLSPVRVMQKNEVRPAAPAPTPAAPSRRATASTPSAAAPIFQRASSAPTLGRKPALAGANVPVRKETPQAQPAESERLRLSLAELAETWPDSIRLEVANQNFSNGVCAIPISELREGMKQGKLQFPWKQIRSWIEPSPSGPTVYGELLVELSLPTVSPGLLPTPAEPAASAPAARPAVGATPSRESIPDVFAKATPATGGKIAFSVPPSFNAATPATPAPAPAAPAVKPVKAATPARTATKPLAASASPAAPAATPSGTAVVVIPIATLKSTWPEALQQEIEKLRLSQGSLEIPLNSIEVSLKLGKVSYPWKQLWAWLKPQPAGGPAQCNADLLIDMPLDVIAPIYLEQRPKPMVKKLATVINIPDLFNATGPVPTAAPAAEPASPVPAPVAAAPTVLAPMAGPRVAPQSLGELFGAPDKRSWTPNEIVQHTSTLPGVLGSLIALQDGLLVASCMPPTWKTETIAAFLPQIFGRLRQYSRELDMGELVSASFGVEQGTFQVFNAGIIYFAACGRPGQLLPIPELQVIATELSRHTK